MSEELHGQLSWVCIFDFSTLPGIIKVQWLNNSLIHGSINHPCHEYMNIKVNTMLFKEHGCPYFLGQGLIS